MSKIKSIVFWIIYTLLCIGIYVWGLILYMRTFVQWWMPVVFGLAAAFILWFPWRSKWKFIKSRIGAFCAHMALFSIIAGTGVMALNYYSADNSKKSTQNGEVIHKYTELHKPSHRVGRRRVYSKPYTEYYLRIQLENGLYKDFKVTKKRYNRTRSGSTIPMDITPGALGYPVTDFSI